MLRGRTKNIEPGVETGIGGVFILSVVSLIIAAELVKIGNVADGLDLCICMSAKGAGRRHAAEPTEAYQWACYPFWPCQITKRLH